MKFDAFSQTRFAAIEAASDLREVGNAQCERLMSNPSAGLCYLTMPAWRCERFMSNRKTLTRVIYQVIDSFIGARTPRLAEQLGRKGIAAEDTHIIEIAIL